MKRGVDLNKNGPCHVIVLEETEILIPILSFLGSLKVSGKFVNFLKLSGRSFLK